MGSHVLVETLPFVLDLLIISIYAPQNLCIAVVVPYGFIRCFKFR
jgi:hypothetical protein